MDLRDQLQHTLGDAYTLERELGGGGMSRVFLAREVALGRQVVIKVLPPETAAQLSTERFKREIALAAQLQQAHIVPLLSAGEANGLPYYTMPFVAGESLRARLGREGALPIGEAIGILKEVARALAYAHQHGIVHRDIKPDNVLLSGGSAMVTDFGVAKALSASANSGTDGLTSVGVALGTPAYMAPEQVSADPLVDHRADLYAWGVMAYELLTGQPPFAGLPPQALLAAHINEVPEALAKRRSSVPAPLASLVMKCLEKRAADRPQTAGEIVQALEAIGTPSGESRPATPSVAGGAALGSRWARPGARVAAAALVVVLGGVSLVMSRQPPRVGSAAKSIAVLPFEDLAASKENAFFSEGITIEITNAVSRLPGLTVTPYALVRADTARGLDIRRAGRELRVGWLLQGTIQRSAERVRINATLIDAANGFHVIWSTKYDNDFKDIFAVQDTIGHAIVNALQVRLAGGAAAPVVRVATTSAEAHALYLQGLYAWNRRTPATIRQAISYFEQAIQKDPQYAQAYAGVGMAYMVLPAYADASAAEMFAKAEAAARRALAIDSTSVEAYATVGYADFSRYRNASAERALLRALALDSTFATAHQWYAQLLSRFGRHDKAVAEARRALTLEPQSAGIRSALFGVLYGAHRLSEAETTARQFIVLDPGNTIAHSELVATLLAQGRNDEAITATRRGLEVAEKRQSLPVAMLGLAYVAAGQPAQARELLRELLARARHEPVSAAGIALIYDALGERDNALQWLGQAVTDFDTPVRTWARGPLFDGLRTDSRGAALLARTEALNDTLERRE